MNCPQCGAEMECQSQYGELKWFCSNRDCDAGPIDGGPDPEW